MGVSVEVTRQDRFSLKGLEDKGIANVAVGFEAEDAVKAQSAEYGDPERGVPPRPFLSHFAQRWERFLAVALEDIVDIEEGGLSYEDGEALGRQAERMLKRTIDEWAVPPNAPSTIERKGKNDPLVDTGQMRDNIKIWIDRA